MEEENSNVQEIFSAYSQNEDEIDISSCDLYIFPMALFELSLEYLMTLILDHNNLQSIPNSISMLSSLKELSAIGNELTELPNEITMLTNLQVLLLNENGLSSLPEEFGNLKSLRNLSAIGNNLSSLPMSFTSLNNLEELYLDENKIVNIPCDLNGLESLIIFEISNNQLSLLPKDIGDLIALEILTCNNNKISCLPESLSCLHRLKILDLSNNQIELLPDTLLCAESLEKLYLENNTLKQVPMWFSCLKNLQELTIAENALCNGPFGDDFCTNLLNLQKLEAGSNFMTSLSERFGNLRSLQYIHFGSTISELERSNFQNGNWLKVLPDSICNLTKLNKANINENQIARLPDEFGKLTALTWLDFGQNMLEHLPDSFCLLVNLEFLQLSKNQLKELPKLIGNLQKLIDLRLDNNLLMVLPESIGTIKCLQTLDLFHNQLVEIPKLITKLTNLKRLDLDQNAFPLKIEEIPKITPGNKYPERDPTLKDNWRGKTRQDKIRVDVIDIDANTLDYDNEIEQWDDKALVKAMQRGMSIWRGHSDSDRRQVYNKECEDNHINSDDDWVALSYNIYSSHSKEGKAKDPDVEDWDDEIEQDNQYNNVINTCYERKLKFSSLIDSFQNTINRYPPANQAYSKTAHYDSFVYKKSAGLPAHSFQKNNRFVVTFGQFDDVE